VAFEPDVVVVTVALRRRRLACPHCDYMAAGRDDTRSVDSSWRHLDLGVWRLVIRGRLRRVACPTHGVVTEAGSFARAGSQFTCDFEDLVGYLAPTTDKTTICRLVRIDWDSVGRIIARVMGEKLDPRRLEDLFEIGVDEVSWRRGHRYVTLVSNHRKNQVVWGKEGRDTARLDTFFDELAEERAGSVTAVSMDMSAGDPKSIRTEHHAPHASSATTPLTSSPWPPRPWTGSAVTTGRRCAGWTREPPNGSRGRGGACSRTPRTSPTSRRRPCDACAATPGRCGAPKD